MVHSPFGFMYQPVRGLDGFYGFGLPGLPWRIVLSGERRFLVACRLAI